MAAYPNSLALWGYAVSALLHLAFSLYLLAAWRGRLAGVLLIVAIAGGTAATTANWAYVYFAQFWIAQLAAVLDAIRYAAWFAFLLLILQPLGGARVRWLIALAWGVAIAQLLTIGASGFELRIFGDPFRYTILASLGAAIVMLTLTEQVYRTPLPGERWGIMPLCLGLGATSLFDLYYFADGVLFARLDSDVWAIRGLVHAVVLPLFALSAVRNPGWMLKVSISRELAFHSSALAVSGLYLLLISAAGYYVRYFGGEWGRALQLTLLFCGLVLLGFIVLSGSQRAKLRVILSKHLFPYRYDYRTEWLRFTRALTEAEGTLDLGESIIKALGDLVESTGGGMWLKNSRGDFAQTARLNMPVCPAREAADSSFCRFLWQREWVYVMDRQRSALSGEGLPDVPVTSHPEWLSELEGAWLVVPLVTADSLAGFVVLLAPRTRFDIDWEVLDLLKTAQKQAASYLTRTLATEALLEAQKFDSFNRMSAFVVHDLKNLVAQLALMLKNAERHRHNPAFQDDMLDTVAHVENKMRGLMSQLQEKTSIDPPEAVDLAKVLRRVVSTVKINGQDVHLACASALVVSAHPARLERVIGHVVQNALDAVSSHGKVSVQLRGDDSRACIEVEDNGCGMSPEFLREQLFRPFKTTKSTGMGIGMYETQQYVHQLGGRIEVDSAVGSGTKMSVTLPLYRTTSESPLLAVAEKV